MAVLSGTADAGLGIFAAAKALNLDFIPVVTEQYDLIIPEAHFESDNIQVLLETIDTDRFKRRVESPGRLQHGQNGHDCRLTRETAGKGKAIVRCRTKEPQNIEGRHSVLFEQSTSRSDTALR